MRTDTDAVTTSCLSALVYNMNVSSLRALTEHYVATVSARICTEPQLLPDTSENYSNSMKVLSSFLFPCHRGTKTMTIPVYELIVKGITSLLHVWSQRHKRYLRFLQCSHSRSPLVSVYNCKAYVHSTQLYSRIGPRHIHEDSAGFKILHALHYYITIYAYITTTL